MASAAVRFKIVVLLLLNNCLWVFFFVFGPCFLRLDFFYLLIYGNCFQN